MEGKAALCPNLALFGAGRIIGGACSKRSAAYRCASAGTGLRAGAAGGHAWGSRGRRIAASQCGYEKQGSEAHGVFPKNGECKLDTAFRRHVHDGYDQPERSEAKIGSRNGAQEWNRTTDTAIFSRMLYQLSYLGAAGLRRRREA